MTENSVLRTGDIFGIKLEKNKMKKKISIILIAVFLGYIYFLLETFFYSDFGCGCSSGCEGFYPKSSSRIMGDILLAVSFLVFLLPVFGFKKISKWWCIPSLFVFMLAFYGNGYMLFNRGMCGFSINQTTFFIHQTRLGDFAKQDGEYLDVSSIKTKKYKGKLLGYLLKGNDLTLYRIDEEPIIIKTSFLFWQTDNAKIIENLSNGLNTYRNVEAENIENHYEYIGGKNMPLESFLQEFKTTEKELLKKIKTKKIINNPDGTTRLIIETI